MELPNTGREGGVQDEILPIQNLTPTSFRDPPTDVFLIFSVYQRPYEELLPTSFRFFSSRHPSEHSAYRGVLEFSVYRRPPENLLPISFKFVFLSAVISKIPPTDSLLRFLPTDVLPRFLRRIKKKHKKISIGGYNVAKFVLI